MDAPTITRTRSLSRIGRSYDYTIAYKGRIMRGTSLRHAKDLAKWLKAQADREERQGAPSA